MLRRALFAAGLALGLAAGGARAAEPLKVFAAGSLSAAMPRLIEGAGVGTAQTVFGPAGALGERLRNGETADLFASADMKQAESVLAGRGGTAVPFVRNRMCLLAPEKLGVTAGNMLEKMLSPDLRLVTSTPVTDPGGDYARAVFARAEALQPGAEQALIGKAELLLVGPAAIAPLPGKGLVASLFATDRADLVLGYCSSAGAAAKEVPGLVSVPLPESLAVQPVYGFAILSDRPEAAKLGLFMLSAAGQAILADAGFAPLAGR